MITRKYLLTITATAYFGLTACAPNLPSSTKQEGKFAQALLADYVDKNVGNGCEAQLGVAGNEYFNDLLSNASNFANPTEIDFTPDTGVRSIMQLRYRNFTIANCQTELRGYFGPWSIRDKATVGYDRPLGPSMKINPGDVYSSIIINNLPSNSSDIPDKTESLRAHHTNTPAHKTFGGHGGKSTREGYEPPTDTMAEPNIPHDFNVTNMHTHGWHVSPTDNSDNVLIAIPPRSEQDEFTIDHIYNQTINLPKDHVAGTFWYHPHKHGSTTIQVGSGMAGALIVVDDKKGLGAIPAINSAVDNTFVLQQVGYGTDGLIEDYTNLQQKPFSELNRPTLLNGQVFPKITTKKNEVQRWRFIHAGITVGIAPTLVSKLPDCAKEVTNENSPLLNPISGGSGDASYYGIHNLDVIALDGLPTGNSFSTPSVTLSPGYRSDALIKFDFAEVNQTYYLVDANRTACNAPQTGETDYWNSARFVLAQVDVQSGDAQSTAMPTAAQLQQARDDYSYPGGPIESLSINQMTAKTNYVHFAAETLAHNKSNPGDALSYWCPRDGGNCEPCNDQNVTANGNQCSTYDEYQASPEKNDFWYIDANGNKESVGIYMVCKLFDENGDTQIPGPQVGPYGKCMTFNSKDEFVNHLKLDTASAWYVSSQGSKATHVFHIHVNPFQVARTLVESNYTPVNNSADNLVWKDTLTAPSINVGYNSAKDKLVLNPGDSEEPLTTSATAQLLSRYTVFPGAFVQHCHVLNHEDQGMMQIVEVEP